MSAWIKMLSNQEASENLINLFDLVKTPHGTIDNVMRIHSLRPNTMKGHYTLYKSVLHDEENCIPTWLQETISSYVSILNDCEYSFANHWKNAEYLINDKNKSDLILNALKKKKIESFFSGKELALLNYAEKLTLYPKKMVKSDVENLKNLGIQDGEILEANQIICYFNYVNRTINGLGVTTKGDKVGYYNSS